MYLPHCLYTSIHTSDDVVVAQCVVLIRRTEKKNKKQTNKNNNKKRQGCYKRMVLMGTHNSYNQHYKTTVR